MSEPTSERQSGTEAKFVSSEAANISPDPPSDWKPSRGEWLMITCFMIVSLVVALDATILVPVLPTIAESLHGTATETFWTGTVFLLMNATFQPFIISLSDLLGRKPALLGSVALFTLGTVLCCLSQTVIQLLAGRAIQGIGAGGVTTLPNVIFADFIPLRQRPKFIALNQLSWAIGTIIGPLIGGLFADHATWRWCFYINFPFCAIGIVMIPLVVRSHTNRPSLTQIALNLDWGGAFLFTTSLFSFLFGLTCGGTQYAWKDWRTLVPICLGIMGMVLTILWESQIAKPMLRLSIFNSVSAYAAYAATILQGVLIFCEMYYIPLFLESVKSFSPTIAGVGMIPISCTLLPVSVIVGGLIARFGRFRWAIWTGWVITVTATGLLILLDAKTHTAAWVIIFLLIGFGHGLLLMSLNICTQALADSRDNAHAAGMYTFFRITGNCIGVSIGGTVFQNFLAKHLATLDLPVAVAKDAEAFVTKLQHFPPGSERAAYIHAFELTFKNVFEVLVGVAALAMIISLFIGHASMSKPRDLDMVEHSGSSEKENV